MSGDEALKWAGAICLVILACGGTTLMVAAAMDFLRSSTRGRR